MAIVKRIGKTKISFQVKLRGADGHWINEQFVTEREAKIFETKTKMLILSGANTSQANRQLRVDDFWLIWFRDNEGGVTAGWHRNQQQIYRDYIGPMIGTLRVQEVMAVHVKRILQEARSKGRAPSTCQHIFSVLHKMFRDAVEDYDLVVSSPVKRKLKPDLPETERPHLTVSEAKALLNWVRGKPYEIAVWFGIYVGLRVGEIQALKWDCIDFELGVVHIRATFARKENVMRKYPKGRRWHSPTLPQELVQMLLENKIRTCSDFVCPSPDRPMLSYNGYFKALKRYCKEAGVRVVSTHGLRHSTAAIYLAHGATKDDLRELFAHSSAKVTERYIHGKSKRLADVAKVIQLKPKTAEGS